MTDRAISLDDYRTNLNVRMIVQNLIREGYEEGSVQRVVAQVMLENRRELRMADVLVMARRQLLIDSRRMVVRRR